MKRQCEITHCCLILHCHFKSHWHCHKVKQKFKTLHFFFSSWGDPEVTVWNSLSLLHFSMSLYFASALSQNEVTMFFPYFFPNWRDMKRHWIGNMKFLIVASFCFLALFCIAAVTKWSDNGEFHIGILHSHLATLKCEISHCCFILHIALFCVGTHKINQRRFSTQNQQTLFLYFLCVKNKYI